MIKNASIFEIVSNEDFSNAALDLFQEQYHQNTTYQAYCNLLNKSPKNVKEIEQIPFLPIDLFKNYKIVGRNQSAEKVFHSSGTTGNKTSKHYVTDISLYEASFQSAFEMFFGKASEFCILALLPSYLERGNSSLIYMVDHLMQRSKHALNGFYLNNHSELVENLKQLEQSNQKTILFGVSFALLDLIEQYELRLPNTTIIETGGMKGRRKELIREELHQLIGSKLKVKAIHSEYGMTELLSQAYTIDNNLFKCPPWMKVFIRQVNDPFQLLGNGKTGGINIIDLANKNSCAFIATQDLGKLHSDDTFEVLGRFDFSDIRGCNLLVNNT